VRPYDLAGAAYDLPEWKGPPRRSLVICTHPRSGSTLLGEALAFAGGLGAPLEYFHRGFRPAFERRWETRGLDALRRAAHRHRTEPNGTFAAKLFWADLHDVAQERGMAHLASACSQPADRLDDATYRELWSCAAALVPNPVFVHLTRRDRIRQAVSALFAQQSGQWRAIPVLGEDGQREPAYDRQRIQYLAGLAMFVDAHWERLFAAIGARPCTIAYEDLDRDYAGTVGALLVHLGRPAAAAPQRLRRQSDARTEAFVLRFLRETASDVG
jgi:LPS sulfotransferase NodH